MPTDPPVRLTCADCALCHDAEVTSEPASTSALRAFFIRHARCTTSVDDDGPRLRGWTLAAG